MSLLRTFVAHEAATQLRSTRFRVMSTVYVIACSVPVALVFVLARRATFAIGSTTYATLLDGFQPLFTTLFAAILAVDAITREREEGSFPVVSLAPISAAGYLLRRWLSVVLVALPVTLLPRLVAMALAAFRLKQTPVFLAFGAGWLLYVLPILAMVSAFAIALGTIHGNSIVALVVGMMLLTAGLGMANDVFARWHRNFDPPVWLISQNPRLLTEIRWSIQGFYEPHLPTEAGYPLTERARSFIPRAAMFFGLTAALLGLATIYLRRTRRDVRPIAVRNDHQLRSFIRLFNRLRDTYSPDGSIGAAEWTAIAAGVSLFAIAIVYLNGRVARVERLGAERYAAYVERDPLEMTTDVVPAAVHVRGTLGRDGRLQSHGELTLRNGGASPVAHLGFALSPQMTIRSLQMGRGSVHLRRLWQRVGIEVDPPLAPGEERTLVFDLDGMPGEVVIPIPWRGDWRAKWHRYAAAKTSVELSDLSHATFLAAADETHVSLAATDLVPVPRYTPWRIDEEKDRFVEEAIEPAATIDLVLQQPFGFLADSCGHMSARGATLQSRCGMPLASYTLAGGPLVSAPIAPGITLANIPAHDAIARVQAPALAAAVARAEEAWNGLTLPRPIVYLERPATARDQRWENAYEWNERHEIAGTGTLQLIPENVFNRYRPIDEGGAAAALIVNALHTRRPVEPREAPFFITFYRMVAMRHVGARTRGTAVVPPTRVPPLGSLLSYDGDARLPYVTQMLEARAGANHVVEGINDFVAAGPRPGTSRELFAAIGRRAGIDFTRLYDDYVLGSKAPRLTMENVTFRRIGTSWEVRGIVHNDGTGEAFCPLALRTASGSLWQTVRVDGGERVPFVFTAAAEPHTLQLDPDRVCYRDAFIGAIESVDYRGES